MLMTAGFLLSTLLVYQLSPVSLLSFVPFTIFFGTGLGVEGQAWEFGELLRPCILKQYGFQAYRPFQSLKLSLC
jgi:hypothetical protein